MEPLTVAQAAEKLGVSVRRVQQLIADGRLPTQKFGRAYMIKESDLKLVKDRKPGRPAQKAAKKNGGKNGMERNDRTK